MSELFRRFIRPARKQSIFRTERAGASDVTRVFAGLIACLIVSALLSSGRLVAMAERQEFGADRDRSLAAAEAFHSVASGLALNKPAEMIEAALDRSEGEPGEVVLGELAATAPSTTMAIPTTTAVPAAADDTTTTPLITTTSPVPSTTAPPTTPPPPSILGDISVNNPLRVWTGGDSLGEYVGSELLYRVADRDLSTVELDFAISTGLARPDFYDWPAHLSEVMQREDRPNVVVFMAGGNDDQDLRVGGERVVVGTPEWRTAYRQRVATMMDIAAHPEVQMLWINLPPMRDGRREGISLEINAALAAEAELRPWVHVVDIVSMFTGPSGGYDQFIDAPDGSATRKARASDGVHITRQASNWVAEEVWAMISARWRFDYVTPATTVPATTVPATIEPTADATSPLPGAPSSSTTSSSITVAADGS